MYYKNLSFGIQEVIRYWAASFIMFGISYMMDQNGYIHGSK